MSYMTGITSAIKQAHFVGYESGLFIQFNLTRSEILYYYVSDNKVQPINTELHSAVEVNTQLGK